MFAGLGHGVLGLVDILYTPDVYVHALHCGLL